MICPMCNKGKLKKGLFSYRRYGVLLGKYPADICTYCKEAWFDESTLDKIQRKSKKLGLVGTRKRVKADYRNGILKLKLPMQFAKNFFLKDTSIIIKPQGKQKLSVQIMTRK